MNKNVILLLCAAFLATSCGTYTGAGAYMGSGIGAVLGSAIGGITNGPRGSDVGTLVGMASGAIVGAAIGSQADKVQEENAQAAQAAARYRTRGVNVRQTQDESGYDAQGRGDDTLYDFNGSEYTGNYTASNPIDVEHPSTYENIGSEELTEIPVEIRNARFVDDNQDFSLSPDELAKVIFEVYNTGSETIYDVQPVVEETTGNKQISISSSIHIEQIEADQGVRYTAMVKAGSKLKDGTVTFRIYAVQGNGTLVSNSSEFNIVTNKE
ncbi:MAG: glycine zipper domain-containing protein [Prevotella sp.]|nr:glycine zipper domain-containing protein [Prevotella sp.]